MAFAYFWALGQLFGTVWLFMGKHPFVGLVVSISCFLSFVFPEAIMNRQEAIDFNIGGKTITVESHRITSPDGGCTFIIYEPIIKGLVAETQYSFFASSPALPFSEFIKAEETENGYSIILNYERHFKKLIVSYDRTTDEWSEQLISDIKTR